MTSPSPNGANPSGASPKGTPNTGALSRRTRSYGERPSISQNRHYIQVMVYSDCQRKLKELMDRHNLSASGAAHHLMRLGAGLAPLPPLDQLKPSPTQRSRQP